MSKSNKVVSLVSSAPILAITGLNGSGKTLLAVSSAVEHLEAGGTVLSTVAVTSPSGKQSVPLLSLSQLLDARDSLVLLDEVSAVFSSRGAALPPEIVTLLQILRKRNCRVIWTAPSWKRTDLILREVTTVQVLCTPVLRKRSKGGSLWRDAVISKAEFLDRRDATDTQADSTIERIRRPAWFRLAKLPGFGAYDTFADSPQIGGLSVTGRCPDCGGKRPDYSCTSETHHYLELPTPLSPLNQMRNLLHPPKPAIISPPTPELPESQSGAAENDCSEA